MRSARAVGGMVQEKVSPERHSSWTLFTPNACAPMRCLPERKQEGQHPLTGQLAANFRLLANQ